MSNYPVPPPSYGAAEGRGARNEVEEPLLGSSSRAGPGGFYDQPGAGELPDDFKVCFHPPLGFPLLIVLKYGVSVSESSVEIRNAFIRKVYTILCEHFACRICVTPAYVLDSVSDCAYERLEARVHDPDH